VLFYRTYHKVKKKIYTLHIPNTSVHVMNVGSFVPRMIKYWVATANFIKNCRFSMV